MVEDDKFHMCLGTRYMARPDLSQGRALQPLSMVADHHRGSRST